MTIEVKQLVIKSTVQSEHASFVNEQQSLADISALREELMAECRELVVECLRECDER